MGFECRVDETESGKQDLFEAYFEPFANCAIPSQFAASNPPVTFLSKALGFIFCQNF